MKVMITRKNGDLSDSLKDYIEKKVSELGRHFPNIIDAHVIIDASGRQHSVEGTMRVARKMLVSRLLSSNLRAAIDGCVIKLEKQLFKVKGKYKRRGRKDEVQPVPVGLTSEEASAVDNEEDNLTLLTIERGEIVLETEERTGTSN